MHKLASFLLPLAVLAAGCAGTPSAPQAPAAPTKAEAPLDVNHDYHSYANTRDFRTTHVALDLAVHFDRRVIDGTVVLDLQRLSSSDDLVLDTRDLDIAQVETAAGKGAWTPTAFRLDARDAILGSALHVAMPPAADRVRIHYATHPEATGLQWVTPAQTAGKKHPFLYSQNESIHARSWIPLQDTPQVRSTYSAHIRTPKDLFAVMSAKNRPEARRNGDYRFDMPQAVPSYLIALAVGDIKFRPIGPRTGVYAEPSVVRAAAHEFEDVEKMMQAVEKLFGPYRWGRYDILVLPPSFPYGGMENPRLTFATPTAIVGDKSGVSLIAHELSHSWSGNLVTNATWRDFWLNEGFTDYLTYRVMEEVYGKSRADMERVLGQQDLLDAFDDATEPRFKALAFDQRNLDPDAVYSSVPYERGRLFLEYLAAKFGRERFEAFLRGWFDEHAFRSQTTEDFLAYLDDKLLKPNPGVVPPSEVQQWVYAPEMPADAVYATSDVFAKVDAQREAWVSGRLPTGKLATKGWDAHQWQHFLDHLPQKVSLSQLAALDGRFHLTQAHDASIAVSWFRVGIRNGYKPVYPAVEHFLLTVGRMKFLNPLYRELVKTDAGRALAQQVFDKAKDGYHPIARATVERILAEQPKKS